MFGRTCEHCRAEMIRTTSISLVSAAVILLALTGCPGKLESSPTDSCKSYYAALAGYYERCEIFPNRLVPARARFEEQCADLVVAPGASNVVAHLDRCASEILESSCGALSNCTLEVTTGDLADGAPCGAGFQCKSGRCEKPRDVACGVCASPPGGRAPVGGPCEDGAVCVEGAACIVSSDGAKCFALERAQSGEPCGSRSDALIQCAKGLTCFWDSLQAGTCRAPVGVGGECRSLYDCTDGLACIDDHCVERLPEGAACEVGHRYRYRCAKGLACDGTCKKMLWVEAGEPCDTITRWCKRGDCVRNTTEPSSSDTLGTCVDLLPEGAACDDGIKRAPHCEPPASCIKGKCTVFDPAACK